MTNELENDYSEANSITSVILEFYPKDKRPFTTCINEFNRLVKKEIVYNLGLNLDFENMPAKYFITADILESRSDLVALYNHLTNSKIKDCSIQMAGQVRKEYLASVAYFKEKYEWIYNPPTIGQVSKPTIGKEMRAEFTEHYGAYAEITYLLCGGDVMKFENINNMRLDMYLSLGEYFLRKKIVESYE